MLRAAVLIIGNEILSGRTRDANLAFVGRQLDALGIRLAEARVVADESVAIVAAVNALRSSHDYVFTTGGIGPTHDDITTDSIAQAFGVGVTLHTEARARLARYYGSEEDLTPPRLRMARIPDGATLIDNPVSAAPGFRIGNVFVFAGVPSIMQGMFESVRGELGGGPPIRSVAVSAQCAESRIALGLTEIQRRYPSLTVGSYPSLRDGQHSVEVVLRGVEPDELARARAEVTTVLRAAGCEPDAI